MRRVLFAILHAIHGAVHLMGPVDFWGIADLEEVVPPDASAAVVNLLGGLWLLAGVGFVVGAVALWRGARWWCPSVLATAMLSFVIAGVVWADAWAGMILDIAIAVIALSGRLIPSPDRDSVPPTDGSVARTHVTVGRPGTRRIAPR
ncbi:MAG: hypothetical protein M3173_09430 [Chloroflexota bacterium]|nr:hypothetical protein [Chloroflexota bacterium]